jgi:hypothetical protein
MRKAARLYSIPYTTLHDRLKGVQSKREIRAAGHNLTEAEEEVLIQRILDLDQQGFPLRMSVVRETANMLRASRPTPPQEPVGKNWVTRLINRTPTLRSAYTRSLDYKRSQCEDPELLRGWFRLVRNMVAKHGILEEDIYNFDETGFAMGLIATSKVVTGAERRGRPKLVQPGNREWVTVIDAINGKGWSVPPFVILKGKVHLRSWYEIEGLPRNWRLAVSDNGWTNDLLAVDWLQHFHEHTIGRTRGAKRLLIMDGHGSHHTAQFEEFCKEHGIITLCMPPHSSHILQPLDVACFGPLKTAYGSLVESQMRLGFNHISKEDFLDLYHTAHDQAITQKNIQSGFRATGLLPFDPEVVLSIISPIICTPSPQSSSHSIWTSKTPHTVPELQKQAQHFKQRAYGNNLPSSPTENTFRQLIKGCEMAIHNGALLAAENKALREANKRRERKKKARRATIAVGGSLTIGDGQNTILDGLVQAQLDLEVRSAPLGARSSEPLARKPRKCSMCESLEHTARTCPKRQK